MGTRIHFCALILALTVAALLAYPDIIAISQSAISTAPISYIFLPFAVAPAIILILLVYYFAIFARRKIIAGERKATAVYGGLSLILLLCCGFYLANEYVAPCIDSRKIARTVAQISKMDHVQIDSLIGRYSSLPESGGQRIFILNALLERQDLTASELDEIAKIRDPAIHDRLYSRYGFLGKNASGLSIARLVALHQNVASSTLSHLAEFNEPYLQGTVAGNSKTPMASLKALYEKSKTDKDGYLIQWELAHNKYTPVSILMELSLSSDGYTKLSAEQTLKAVKSDEDAGTDRREFEK